jgi:hypothetical protein
LGRGRLRGLLGLQHTEAESRGKGQQGGCCAHISLHFTNGTPCSAEGDFRCIDAGSSRFVNAGQEIVQFVGERGFQFEGFISHGMGELEAGGVEEVAVESQAFRIGFFAGGAA